MNRAGLWLLPVLALAGGCSSQKEDAPRALTLHEVMKNEIDLRADDVWAVGNAAIGDDAGIDPAKMTDEDWARLAASADSLQQAANEIARMDPVVVAKPGVKIGDEGIVGGHSAAQVQAEIDKDPQKLRDMAGVLAVHVGDLANAARMHDAAVAGPLIDQLDGVCENCHLEFWYPSQKAEIEKYMKGHV